MSTALTGRNFCVYVWIDVDVKWLKLVHVFPIMGTPWFGLNVWYCYGCVLVNMYRYVPNWLWAKLELDDCLGLNEKFMWGGYIAELWTTLRCLEWTEGKIISFPIGKLPCRCPTGSPPLCASFGITRLICASFGSTRLICVSVEH